MPRKTLLQTLETVLHTVLTALRAKVAHDSTTPETVLATALTVELTTLHNIYGTAYQIWSTLNAPAITAPAPATATAPPTPFTIPPNGPPILLPKLLIFRPNAFPASLTLLATASPTYDTVSLTTFPTTLTLC